MINNSHTHPQPDPDMIEGDEGEVVVPSEEALRGETLLVKEYSTTKEESRPHTRSLSKNKGEGGGGVKAQATTVSSSPAPSPGPRIHSVTDSVPPLRPVTPQSFRSHSSTDIHTSRTLASYEYSQTSIIRTLDYQNPRLSEPSII